jgi:hypothetical protein
MPCLTARLFGRRLGMNRGKFKYILPFVLIWAVLILVLGGCGRRPSQPLSTSQVAGNGNLQITVADLSGQPLWGAKVVSEEQPENQLKVSGLTDANGMVIFKDIRSGVYKFYVSRFDYAQMEMTVNVANGETTNSTVNMTSTEQAVGNR